MWTVLFTSVVCPITSTNLVLFIMDASKVDCFVFFIIKFQIFFLFWKYNNINIFAIKYTIEVFHVLALAMILFFIRDLYDFRQAQAIRSDIFCHERTGSCRLVPVESRIESQPAGFVWQQPTPLCRWVRMVFLHQSSSGCRRKSEHFKWLEGLLPYFHKFIWSLICNH